MSPSYTVLAATLIGVAGLAGLAHLASGGDDAAADAAASELTPAIDPTDEVDVGDDESGPERAAEVDVDCTLSVRLQLGDRHAEVACLESQLIAAGTLVDTTPDGVFDEATETAVRSFQARHGLVVDGVVGPQTASEIGEWIGPEVLPPDPATCQGTGRSAVIDRFNQRTWLCESGAITEAMPMTSAVSQPDPGTYEVYAKDLNASSTLTGDYSEMTHFVAFTYGRYQGARIAFHSVPTYSNGEYVQPLDTVGTAELHGDSSGCIRVLPDDAELIWNWLDIGDTVTVIT